MIFTAVAVAGAIGAQTSWSQSADEAAKLAQNLPRQLEQERRNAMGNVVRARARLRRVYRPVPSQDDTEG